MKTNHIYLILLSIIIFSIACTGLKTVHNPNGENFYEEYKLRGPDSYYNLKMCTQQLVGNYNNFDLEISYPYGHLKRPMLFTAITTNLATITSFMSGMHITDALGWTMLLIPCLFGALTVFPVYGIAKEMLNKKLALISAFLFTITPVVYSASHGSLAGLFDHDSFLLFFTMLFIYGFMKYIKTPFKDRNTIIYFSLCVISLSAIYMTWVVHHFIFVSLAIIVIVTLFISAIKEANPMKYLLKVTLMLDATFLATIPYAIQFHVITNIILYSAVASTALLLIYLLLKLHNRSQIVQIGFLSSIMGIVVIFLYTIRNSQSALLGPLTKLSNYAFGSGGIYSSRITSTIGEAQLTSLTSFMMGFGLVLFIFALLGFIVYLHKVYNNIKPKHITFIVMFIITMFFSIQAGRFAKDLSPFIAIFGAIFLYIFVKEINIKKLKEMRIKPLVSCTIVFLLFSSSIYITATTVTSDSLYNEDKLIEVCSEIRNLDTDEPILAFWDYGFYIDSMTNNPVIADNFQQGIYVSCNFLTAQSEKEAFNVLTVYLIKAEYEIFGNLSKPTINTIVKHLREYTCKPCGKSNVNKALEFIEIIKNSSKKNDLYVNALPYLSHKTLQEAHKIFTDIQLSTGFPIGYVMIGEREVDDIKVILAYLANKSTVGFETIEDDWFKLLVNGKIENKEMFNNSFLIQLYEEKGSMYFNKVVDKNEFKIWEIEK